ncbi:MAG TPA: hypothetical protein PK490_19200, partial [Prosthecobacter sp.]|nr:hypothetical protein [Prosthecobacter sp.]
VARAMASAQVTGGPLPRVPALDAIPEALELLAAVKTDEKKILPWPGWRTAWLEDRWLKQHDFFKDAAAIAEKSRAAFTAWTTRLMDVMLALSVSALLLTLSWRSDLWLRVLGEDKLYALLGLGGAALALGLLLLQVLRSMQEVNRRVGRFTRQKVMLEKARAELEAAADDEPARRIVRETEAQLLGEVADWHFETENSERFFQIREQRGDRAVAGPAAAPARAWGPLLWLLAAGGAGMAFLLRVVLGRAPWVAGSCALTLGCLGLIMPKDPVSRQRLEAVGNVLGVDRKAWNPAPARAQNGCVIIAHGLRDGAFFTARGEESRWMSDMAMNLAQRLDPAQPNIGLVDWSSAAMPSQWHGLLMKQENLDGLSMGLDLALIRDQAREVGDHLGFRLAQWIRDKDQRIRRDKPLHLIGHSAGGFLVARAALVLSELGLAPETMHVTILDTPGTDDALFAETGRVCRMEFYKTSDFVTSLDVERMPEDVFFRVIPPPGKPSLREAHSYAWEWYSATICECAIGDEGFGRSPFLLTRAAPQPDTEGR